MTKEEFYDAEIAPMLLDLIKKCKAEGLSLVAMCEFGPNEMGTTLSIRDGAGIEIVMARMGIQARGNADALLMGLKQHAEKHGHQSAMIELLGVPASPK